ncbi:MULTISPECIES: hypothetical protein [Lysinibacillus]|nr:MULTISPECIES: hypothetical protein [Lysinibacillus]MCS1396055.1 hypothetical protein [Lysinibacillus sp. PB211]MDR0159208.1 hypothetical protein [Lysinibacillus sphaericus]UZM97841.1 hypothetical protein OL548_23165 [Lysinibacillus sp. MHQ-1]
MHIHKNNFATEYGTARVLWMGLLGKVGAYLSLQGLGKVIEISGNRYLFAQLINQEVRMDKT